MWDEFKRTFSVLFKTPTPLEIAAREVAEAERQLLSAHTAREYADAMVMYNQERIHRLRNFIKELQE
jgi:hypothetical protein